MRIDLEAAMERKGMSENVRARIRRLNPNPQEGERMRGWHPTRTARNSIHRDVCSRQTFEKRWGKGSAQRLPPGALVKAGGRRRWISGMAYVQGPMPITLTEATQRYVRSRPPGFDVSKIAERLLASAAVRRASHNDVVRAWSPYGARQIPIGDLSPTKTPTDCPRQN